MKKKKHHYISVMGTMGSGKTTAARLIAEHFHYHLIEENFGENAFLPRFYKTMDRWAFHSQTFFLMEKINQLMEIAKKLHQCSIVQDTPIEQDVFSYAKAQHAMGHMDDAEWRLYQKIYASFVDYLPKPDCIIYLETSLPVVMKRIVSRGRSYESAVPKSYIKLLDTLNTQWIGAHTDHRIVMVQTDNVNIVRSADAQKQFLSQIQAVL